MPKKLSEISSSGTLGVILATSTQGSGHFENTMLVVCRFLAEVKWTSATIWLLFETEQEEEDAEVIKEKVEDRIFGWFTAGKLLCKPNVIIWKSGEEISADDLICITGGLDVSSVQPQPMVQPLQYTWNTAFTAINTRYLIQCQPLWWQGESEKWDGSDANDNYVYVNGAQSGLWRAAGEFEYDDGEMYAPTVVRIDTPDTLPRRIIRPFDYLELIQARLARKNQPFFSIIMYGSYPAGNDKLGKHLAIYRRMLKCFQFITNAANGRPIRITRISSGDTQEAEAEINQIYRSDNLQITAVDRLPKAEFQTALCNADLMVSEGQNIENECLSLHVPVFQWRDVQNLATNNQYNVMVPQAFQDLEKATRANLGDGYQNDIGEFNAQPSAGRFLTMMVDGLGDFDPQVWQEDKLSILLTTLAEYLATVP